MTGHGDFEYRSADGLRLAGRIHGSLEESPLPLVCLSGLTRNGRYFDRLAAIVRSDPRSRPVVTFDYRGRGRSERAPDAATYTVPQELADVTAGLDAIGIGRAVFLGTSRGALILHLLATARPSMIAAAILNDAGPRLEREGLAAIRDYVGRFPGATDWAAASEAIERLHGPAFPALSREDFEAMTRANLREEGGRIVADYDERLAEGLAAMDLDAPLPELWREFEALRDVPTMVIRGEHSRLLSAETVRRMAGRHPRLVAVEAPGQGHAPLLELPLLAERILAFCDAADPRPARA